MKRYDLALIGFGGVNRTFAELIHTSGSQLTQRLGFELRVVAVTDLRFGTLIQPDGIDLETVLAMQPGDSFSTYIGGHAEPQNEKVIRDSPADIIVEATFTNPHDGEPAVSHVRWALESDKHVTTTNKGPIAFAGPELKELARRRNVRFEYEGSVMSGTPVIRFAKEQFAGLEINSVEGIFNGTSNFVLGRMEEGLDLDSAVSEAQTLGFAEADPTADIGGSDVQLKVTILANELLGGDLDISQVQRRGITDLTVSDVSEASSRGKRWKLIGTAVKGADGVVTGTVEPRALGSDHPLHGISGATNAVTFHTDMLGAVTVSGPGAGKMETVFALLSDIVAIDKSSGHQASKTSAVS